MAVSSSLAPALEDSAVVTWLVLESLWLFLAELLLELSSDGASFVGVVVALAVVEPELLVD